MSKTPFSVRFPYMILLTIISVTLSTTLLTSLSTALSKESFRESLRESLRSHRESHRESCRESCRESWLHNSLDISLDLFLSVATKADVSLSRTYCSDKFLKQLWWKRKPVTEAADRVVERPFERPFETAVDRSEFRRNRNLTAGPNVASSESPLSDYKKFNIPRIVIE